jgi:hypothetical protein
MEEIQEKLGSILSNPQLMQQIMSMAQSMGQSSATIPEPEPTPNPPSIPDIDLSMVKNLSGLAGQSSIDKEQQALLRALGPYLSRDRVSKLEKAMRAAKMAKFASALLNSGGLQLLTGR